MIHDTDKEYVALLSYLLGRGLLKGFNFDKPAVIEMRQWARRKGRKK